MLRRAARPAVGALGRSFTTESSRAYRELLKAQRELFGEDYRARVAARLETRTQFMQNAGASESDVPGMVQDARDAAVFLRHNVAQTVRNDETGNFELKPKPEHIGRSTTPQPLPEGLDGTPCSRN